MTQERRDETMVFPELTNTERIERLQPPEGALRMVLDTDTYNEVDDQFALAFVTLPMIFLKLPFTWWAALRKPRKRRKK